MSFDWETYLSLAGDLSKNAGAAPMRESRLRTSISRSYYAAFKTAHNHLRDKENDRNLRSHSPASIHKYVRQCYVDGTIMEKKQIGYKLQGLKTERGNADYEDDYQDLDGQVVYCLRLASEVIKLVKALPTP